MLPNVLHMFVLLLFKKLCVYENLSEIYFTSKFLPKTGGLISPAMSFDMTLNPVTEVIRNNWPL